MTWQDATRALLLHFVTRWTALHASIPIDVPNGERVAVDVQSEPWVRLRFIPSFATRVAVGGQLREQAGRAVVTTFTPRHGGDAAALGYDREIESIWETAHTNGLTGALHLGAPEAIQALPDPDVPMYRSGVSLPFRFDHSP